MRNTKGQFVKGHKPHPNWIKKWLKPKEKRECLLCNSKFRVLLSSIQIYCTRKCADKHRGEMKRGIGKGFHENNKYLRSTFGQKKYIHREVMEKVLGRKLTRDEHVHHINRDRKDNRPENLIVISNREHQKLHKIEETKRMVCAECSKEFYAMYKPYLQERYCDRNCKKKNWRRKRKLLGLKRI